MTVPEAHAEQLSLAIKVARLKDPRAYPQHPTRVGAIETHMSWVFLTDAYAYKLKKPARHAYLNFTTLAAREWSCREELRLNQALAPGVYLDVVPLVTDAAGEMYIERDGEVVEWLVKMRRLPAERMLDHLIRAHEATPFDIERLAHVLVAFYRESSPVALSAADYLARYRQMIAENERVLSASRYALSTLPVRKVHEALARTLKRRADMFARRVLERRIIEGHGDLRPEHACLEARPVIFDRLEFNRELRIIDPVEEISFLAMECERLGAAFVGQVLVDAYVRATGDNPPEALRRFYMAHRACVRARLAALHIDDLPPPSWAKWLATAADYLRIAEGYACRP